VGQRRRNRDATVRAPKRLGAPCVLSSRGFPGSAVDAGQACNWRDGNCSRRSRIAAWNLKGVIAQGNELWYNQLEWLIRLSLCRPAYVMVWAKRDVDGPDGPFVPART